MNIECHDMTQFMRQGFRWSDANVEREAGYIDDTKKYGFWNYRRHWVLQDLAEPPQWSATMDIWAIRLETLTTFNLDGMSSQLLSGSIGTDREGHMVYRFLISAQSVNFNAIYDQAPLGTCWSWLKREGGG